MKKILITKKNINEYLDAKTCRLVMEPDMILTPGAKDEVRERNYAIVYKEISESSDEISLEDRIKCILKNDYNVEDEALLKLLVKKIGAK